MGYEKEFRYRVVDVFTEHPLEGNALAVFPDASALDATRMQRIARELNLAETAFVLPPTRNDCVARVRIFTPAKEMVFAGHPTIGTALRPESHLRAGSLTHGRWCVLEEVRGETTLDPGGARRILAAKRAKARPDGPLGSSVRVMGFR
jgi:trans-2,3-dihydro-3-hydroxyanthranilate isomerase